MEELTKDKAELKRSNDLMRTQLDLLEQQNRTLLMNQLSAQQSSQVNGGGFMPGGNFSVLSMPNHVGSHPNGAVNSISGGSPMFNYPSTGFGAPGTSTMGPGGMAAGANGPASFMGGGTVGGGGGSLGQISLLDRLRLQQQLQLQQQQHQQLGLIAPSTGK